MRHQSDRLHSGDHWYLLEHVSSGVLVLPNGLLFIQLAHRIKDKAERAYQRSDLIEKRRDMMEAWANHCDSHTAEVIKLPA